jgi:hypothetical protein
VFYLKGKKKGLSGSDLKEVLRRIDNKDGDMTDEEMFEELKKLC